MTESMTPFVNRKIAAILFVLQLYSLNLCMADEGWRFPLETVVKEYYFYAECDIEISQLSTYDWVYSNIKPGEHYAFFLANAYKKYDDDTTANPDFWEMCFVLPQSISNGDRFILNTYSNITDVWTKQINESSIKKALLKPLQIIANGVLFQYQGVYLVDNPAIQLAATITHIEEGSIGIQFEGGFMLVMRNNPGARRAPAVRIVYLREEIVFERRQAWYQTPE